VLKKILVGLFCLEASLVAHEGAHFVAMRANGVEVEEMSLGIGPILYQKQLPEFKFSVKLIPIMAYVASSKRGMETAEKLPLFQIILIDLAGVFSNLVLASLIFLGLKLKESSKSWLVDFIFLPKNYFLLFKDALIGMVTFGSVKPKNNGALLLENQPNLFWQYLLFLNLMLAIFNLLPAQMLDGGQVFFLFLAIALQFLGKVYGISEKTLGSIALMVSFITFYMLIMLLINGLRMRWVAVVKLEDKKNKTP
jgi:membrane-associated protease RseP (regulator of RpoE activity)